MRIMVVDDDELIRDLMKSLIRQEGFRNVTLAGSAEEALAKLAEARIPYDAFFLDLLMPGTDGIELCRKIRALPAYREVPVVMLTVVSEMKQVDLAFAAGALDYVSKPIVKSQVAEELHMLAQRTARKAEAQLGDVPPVTDWQDGFIELEALENFVRRLSRAGLFDRQIFAFKPLAIPAPTAAPDIAALAQLAAEAVRRSLPDDAFLAHAGGGMILCAARAAWTPDLEAIAAAATDVLEGLPGLPEGEISIRAGKAIRVGQVRSGRSALHSITLALQSAVRAATMTPDETRPQRQPRSRTAQRLAAIRRMRMG